jgi:hypothetical protein
MITAVGIASSGDALALFDFTAARAMRTLLVRHANSPPFGYCINIFREFDTGATS